MPRWSRGRAGESLTRRTRCESRTEHRGDHRPGARRDAGRTLVQIVAPDFGGGLMGLDLGTRGMKVASMDAIWRWRT